jgi:hypothetical protein
MLKEDYKIFNLREIAALHGEEFARQLQAEEEHEGEGGPCVEIHKDIKKMLNLPSGLKHLSEITGDDIGMNPPLGSLKGIFDDFHHHLTRGIDIYMERDNNMRLSKEGLLLLLNHLLSSRSTGLKHFMRIFNIANNPNYRLSRIMYLTNGYLRRMGDFGRAGEWMIMSYAMAYLGWGVGGYGHTIKTFIESNGEPMPDESTATRCGPGNADCVIYAFKTGLENGLSKISSDPEIRQPKREDTVPQDIKDSTVHAGIVCQFPEWDGTTMPTAKDMLILKDG